MRAPNPGASDDGVPSKPLTVAIADDEPEILNFLERVLTFLGWRVVARAENGRELVEKCRAAHPDLIITDIRMPELNGLQAVAEIEGERLTPVIFVSGQHAPEFRDAPYKDYIVNCLVKPIRRSDMQAALDCAMPRLKELQARARRHESNGRASSGACFSRTA